ncbi:MAG TPA: hypothetical protein VHC97_10705 [Thermoanaerobaculia bacterium]|jgi:pterin-4a-carbinolamine dehydratase|nr:hypothetical protein [Thermoanaerobaculia bacterium]
MDTKENTVDVGIGFELPGQGLRRPPRREVEEILVVHDPEERLKSERVEEALRAMPEWELTLEGRAITRVKDLPTPEVASQYTAYVTGLAGHLRLPVAVSVSEGLVMVTLYGPGSVNCMGGLTQSVLDLAHQIG